jgi:adenylate cyclase
MEIAAPTERPRAAAKTGAWSLVAADGTRFLLEGDVATIGRQAGSSIHIPDNNVSRLHAELRRVSGSWTIEDRGSTNGTRINGTMTVDPTPLVDGDLIALGAVELRVERG